MIAEISVLNQDFPLIFNVKLFDKAWVEIGIEQSLILSSYLLFVNSLNTCAQNCIEMHFMTLNCIFSNSNQFR